MSSMEMSNITREKLAEMFKAGKRFDGRELLEHRDLDISFEVSNQAEGSARVKLGKTEVIAGVKMELGTPYPDSPDKGNLMVSGELLPLASPTDESGPPRFDDIELPRLIDRAIRESGMIDFSKLVVEEGEKVWTIIVDLYPINDDGNVIDACSIAAVAALRNAKMPGIKEDGNVDYKNRTDEGLPLTDEINPISFSFFKLGDSLILDPTREEEEGAEARITFGISKWTDGQYMINSCQKNGETTMNSKELAEMVKILPEKLDLLGEKLKKVI